MYEVTPLDGIEQLVGTRANITYSTGSAGLAATPTWLNAR